MKIKVIDSQGKETGKEVKLPDSIFGVEPNEHAMYLAVKEYRNAQRSGNHKARERSEIRGSRKKIKRQKGTGTARAGDIKNPLFRGGGRVFGPRVRDYDIKLNKKVKRLAKVSALSTKVKENALVVVEELSMDTPRTKDFASTLGNWGVEQNERSLYVSAEKNDNVLLSARNIPRVNTSSASGLNTYSIMECKRLILSVDALKQIEEALS